MVFAEGIAKGGWKEVKGRKRAGKGRFL